MKTIAFLTAAAAALFAIPTASAAPVAATSSSATLVTASAIAANTQSRVVVREHRRTQYNRHGRYDRHNRYNRHRRASWRRVCTNRWRHGHRVRVCRNVRYWR